MKKKARPDEVGGLRLDCDHRLPIAFDFVQVPPGGDELEAAPQLHGSLIDLEVCALARTTHREDHYSKNHDSHCVPPFLQAGNE